jgi:hypothetical protein
MSDLAVLGMVFETQGVDEGNRKLDQLADTSAKAERATDALAASSRSSGSALMQMIASIEKSVGEMNLLAQSQRGVVAAADSASAATRNLATAMTTATPAMAKAGAQASATAHHFDAIYDAAQRDFSQQYVRQMGAVTASHAKAEVSSKHLSQAGLGLSRQFADIMVTGAMGMNPFMILIQQGPQIVDQLALMRMQGVGLTAALRGMAAAAVPAMVALAPLIAVAGAAAAGFALMNRELAKDYPKDITDGLGLTEEQLKRVESRTVTMGDTFKSTLDVMGNYLTSGPLGSALDWLGEKWNATLDFMTKVAFEGTAVIIGGFIGAYRAIIDNWRNFPAAIGSILAATYNKAIDGLQMMINAHIAGINMVIDAASRLTGAAMPRLGAVDLSGFKADASGAAEFVGKAIASQIKQSIDDVRGGMKTIGSEIKSGAVRIAQDKARKDAGDAKAGPKGSTAATPRDQTAERTAQIEGLIQAALAAELQARLAVTREIQARADIERQIARAQEAVKAAQLDRQAASIADDDGLSDAKKAELTAQIEIVRSINARAAAYREQAIDQTAAEAFAREAYSVRKGEADVQLRVLASQEAIARYEFQRRALSLERLKIEQDLERLGLERIVASETANEAEKQIARAMLERLAVIHGNETKAATGNFQDTFRRVVNAMNDVSSAFERQDWNALANSIVEAIGTLKEAFKKGSTIGDKIGAIAGIGQMIGGAVGGKAGSAISGASSGAMAGLTLTGGNPLGALAGAAIGGIAGLLSGNKAEKARKNQEAAAKAEAEIARVTQLANAQRSLEADLLDRQGKALQATALRREGELNALDPTLREIQKRIWALDDEADALAKAKAVSEERAGFEIRMMEALGNAAGVLAARNVAELAAADAANRAYLAQVQAVEAAAERVNDARDALSEAYEREAGAITTTRDKFRDLGKSLKDLRVSLDPLLDVSPGASLERTRRDFLGQAASAATGDPDAMAGLNSSAQAFIQASQESAKSLLEHRQNVATVQNAIRAAEAAAANQVTLADQQLSALNASVAGILQVNASVLSVRDALASYQGAVAAQQAAVSTPPVTSTPAPTATAPANDNAATPRQADWASYIAHYSDVAAGYLREMSSAKGRANLAQIGVQSVTGYGEWHWNKYGKGEGRTPYATGGIIHRPMTLGESGIGGEAGPESILPLANVGGKMGVHAVGGGGETANEIRSLRNQVQRLEDALVAIAKTNSNIDRRGQRQESQGVFVRGEMPDEPVSTKEAA